MKRTFFFWVQMSNGYELIAYHLRTGQQLHVVKRPLSSDSSYAIAANINGMVWVNPISQSNELLFTKITASRTNTTSLYLLPIEEKIESIAMSATHLLYQTLLVSGIESDNIHHTTHHFISKPLQA